MRRTAAVASDDSRDRILSAAEALFRRYGYAKTTVAEIARDAGMSPANVYRFFDGKAAIVAAIADLWLAELEGNARRIALRREPAAQRLRAFAVEVFRHTIDRYLESATIHELCQMVMAEQWPIVEGHIERMREIMTLIVADGMQTGEFAPGDPVKTASVLKDMLVKFHHPTIVAQCEAEPLEEQVHDVCDLMLRALRTP